MSLKGTMSLFLLNNLLTCVWWRFNAVCVDAFFMRLSGDTNIMPKLGFKSFLIIFLIIASVIVFALPRGQAKDNNLPFKATTVDECIQEKECVWYAFSNALNIEAASFSLTRWERPIRVHVAGKMNQNAQLELAATLDMVSKNIPIEVKVDKTFNNLIIFSDDFDHDIYQKYRKDFTNVLGDKFDLLFGDKFKKRYEAVGYEGHKCRSAYINDPVSSSRLMSFLFAPQTGRYRRFCIEFELLSSLGTFKNIEGFPFSILNFSIKINPKKSSITEVDVLILRLLYSKYFQTGMNAKAVRSAFDEAYLEEINTIKKGI